MPPKPLKSSSLLSGLKTHEEAVAAKREALKHGLPHLYEKDWYDWSWDFFKSVNRSNFLVAANQIGKSSTQIRKVIEWCGNPTLWPTLWKEPHVPRQMWYFYPSQDVVKNEFNLKWVPEFLPRDEYKNHPTYGWETIKGERGAIDGIRFNSGVSLFFKTYTQHPQTLQTSTVSAIFCDEEIPEGLYDELVMRLAAVEGYFSMVFTATLNQSFWRLVMEGRGEMEKLPHAFKQRVSMYDCISFKNGKPGNFTIEKIREIENNCRSEAERKRRVHGRFIAEDKGRRFPHFDITKHVIPAHSIPGDWRRYCAVDIGSGGTGHPPAIVFVAASPDGRKGVVYKSWRGDDGPTYTNGDVFNKFLDLRGNELITRQVFDFHAKDFGTISQRAGEAFAMADKGRSKGFGTLNTLFRNDMLLLFDTPDNMKLADELTHLQEIEDKRHQKDDSADALRYACIDIPWDWSCLRGMLTEEEVLIRNTRPYTPAERVAMEIEERRGDMGPLKRLPEDDGWDELEDEVELWNEFGGN